MNGTGMARELLKEDATEGFMRRDRNECEENIVRACLRENELSIPEIFYVTDTMRNMLIRKSMQVVK